MLNKDWFEPPFSSEAIVWQLFNSTETLLASIEIEPKLSVGFFEPSVTNEVLSK